MNVVASVKGKISSSELVRRVMRAVVYGIGGSAASRLILVITSLFVARILGKEFYGQFAMVNSNVTLFVMLSGMGLSATLTRYVAHYRNQPHKLGNIIGTLSTFVALLSAIMFVVLWLFSRQLSLWVSGSIVLTGYYKITSFTILFSSLAANQQSVLLGMENYKKNARVELVRCGLYLLVSVLLSLWKGIYGAVWALMIAYILQYMMMYIVNKREYRVRNIKLSFKFDFEIFSILWKFTIPAFIASLFVLPVNFVNNAILTRQVGFGELAVFSVALQWMTMITYIPSQMGQVKPIYTDLFAQNRYDDLRRMFCNITISSIALVTPAVLFGMFFSKFVLKLYGAGYASESLPFFLMMAAALIITIQSQIGALLESLNKMWLGFALNLIWSVVMVGTFYAVRSLGSTGYALSYCVSYGVHTVLSYGVIFLLWKRRNYGGTS